ncbi:hypothetical protein EV138_7117 [Kribbella voronezhensis]|uniref:Lipoprotein n=1 Tax=Kribbella voronezhensis TaxID=2512212 RepID=A0A4R7SV93_9ACTN|nr:hypothetical protein [Kribbella voronezhensis]TDU82228.1 hypothetical protein EV138_7117 [Kribbella voronezhensis]
MRVRVPALVAVLCLLPVVGGCQVGPAAPGPAEFRAGPPPWDAPRDAVSYIDKAGFERLPLDFSGPAPYTLKIAVTVGGRSVQVPPGIGVDRRRAEQAAVHTHSSDGIVYVEAKTTAERPTLKQFFELWGVRYDGKCLGDACGGVTVLVNSQPAAWDTPLQRDAKIQVTAKDGPRP